MKLSRFGVPIAICAIGSTALAVSGPIPLAWRWYAKTTFAPTASPTVSGDTVFAPIGKRVYALDAATGAVRWSFPEGQEPDGDFVASVATDGETALVANTGRFIYGLDRATGNRIWSFVDTGSTRAMIVNAGVVYLFTTDDRIVALNTANGTRAWSNDLEMTEGIAGDPIYVDGNLIFYTNRGDVRALSTSTRKIVWSIGPINLDAFGGPIAYGNFVYVVTGQQIARINPRNGMAVGRPLLLPERLGASVAVTPKGGVAATADAKLYFFDPDLRTVKMAPYDLDGTLSGVPQTAGDNVIVRTMGGSIYLIDPARKDSPVLWEYTALPIAGTMRKITTGTSGGSSGGGSLSGGGGTGGGGGTLGGGGGTGSGGSLSGGGGTGGGQGGGTTTTIPVDALAILGPLAITENAMYGIAEDGSLFAWRSDLGVDEVGPRIVLMYPPEGTHMNGQPDIDFLFRVEDPSSGVMTKSIRVTMNGQVVKHTFEKGPGYLRVKIRTPGSSDEGANPPLTDGRKEFVVTVADWMGNVSEKRFAVTIDNALPKTRERTVDDRQGTTGGGPGIGR